MNPRNNDARIGMVCGILIWLVTVISFGFILWYTVSGKNSHPASNLTGSASESIVSTCVANGYSCYLNGAEIDPSSIDLDNYQITIDSGTQSVLLNEYVVKE